MGGSKEQQDCETDADCNEPGETAGTCVGDVVPGQCDLSRGQWTTGTFCDEGDPCTIFQCYDAEGDCMEGDVEFILCPSGDSDCPNGRMCYQPPVGPARCLMRAGCGNLECCNAVCEVDPYCCNALDGGWDLGCASRARQMADAECSYAPENDRCWDPGNPEAGATEIEILEEDTGDPCTPESEYCSGWAMANNITATSHPTDPGYCCNLAGLNLPGAGNLWYKFTAVHSSAQISTCDTPGWTMDSLIQVFEAGDDSTPQAACESLEIIGCDDDTPGCGEVGSMSQVCVTGLSEGVTYYVVVGGSTLAEQPKGQYILDIESPCPSLPPDGSLCELAVYVPEGTTPFSLQYADLDCPGEDALPAMMNDIWFAHAPTCIGNLEVRTCGLTPEDEDPDTTLAVYCAPFGEDNCPPVAVASAVNDDSELNKTCSIGGQACDEASDCVLGCTGLGILCQSDDDCPGTTKCDLRLQSECSVSGVNCFTDSDCTAGYCHNNELVSCDTEVFEMRCTEGTVIYCPNGDECDYGAECVEYWPSCGWTVDGDDTVARQCVKDDECEAATCDSDCAPASSVVAPVMPGDVCKIRIGGEYGSEPVGDLTIACVEDDCNWNLVPDLIDIEHGLSADCNLNGNPDECDVDPSDPDGDGTVADDCDGNGIPDECQIPVWPEVICKECMRGDIRTGRRCSYDFDCYTCSGAGGYCRSDDDCPSGQVCESVEVCVSHSPCKSGPFFCTQECDPDADRNGIPDVCTAEDSDGDGVSDDLDNCPVNPNPGQEDGDGDGVGNVCDNCGSTPNPGQEDADGDDFGDACDNCPLDDMKTEPGQCGCGEGPMCGFNVECNEDADGVSDCIDACPFGEWDPEMDGIEGCDDAIPTMSQWGLVVMALLLLVAGKVYFGRRTARA